MPKKITDEVLIPTRTAMNPNQLALFNSKYGPTVSAIQHEIPTAMVENGTHFIVYPDGTRGFVTYLFGMVRRAF